MQSQLDINEKIRCVNCQEEIQKGARKCIHCNSFQDWRRFIDISSATISHLIALLSVFGLTAPTIIQSLKTHNNSQIRDKLYQALILAYN